MVNCSIIICSKSEDLLPSQNYGDAGFDLKVAEDIKIGYSSSILIPTGVKIALPLGYQAEVRPRSGISAKLGREFVIANSPGTIDSNYRGEIKIISDFLYSTRSEQLFPNRLIPKGSRIAQLVITPVITKFKVPFWQRIFSPKIKLIADSNIYEHFEEIYPSNRGSKGFGSSGI
jgi:dUTP pyrophosphatase